MPPCVPSGTGSSARPPSVGTQFGRPALRVAKDRHLAVQVIAITLEILVLP